MKIQPSVVLGSLLGACVIHAALAACGSKPSTHAMGIDATADAKADVVSCSSWQTGYVLQQPTLPVNVVDVVPWKSSILNQVVGVAAVPVGWEPIQTEVVNAQSGSADILVHLRKCVSP